MRLVRIEWTDAVGEAGWQPTTRLAEYGNWRGRSLCASVGHLLAELDEGIVVGLSLSDDGESAADSLFIPSAMLRNVEDVAATPSGDDPGRTPKAGETA